MRRERPVQILHLWDAKEPGEDGKGQCSSFKGMMWARIGTNPPGAWLSEVVNPETGKHGIAVYYHPEFPGAQDYAYRAKNEAECVGEQVVTGHQRFRVLARSTGWAR